MKTIVREIAHIVQAVSDKLTPELQKLDSNIQQVSFYCGHWPEIIQRLREKSDSPDAADRRSKFPCIMLVEDIRTEVRGDYDEVTLYILICMSTSQGYSSEQRQEKSFDPILYRMYEEFMKGVANRHGVFRVVNPRTDMPHTRIDRKYAGTEVLQVNDRLKTNDFVDAIELPDLKLKVYPFKPCATKRCNC